MATIVRRKKEPTGPQQPLRMQDVMTDLEVPSVFGVDPVAAKEAFRRYLIRDVGTDKAYCTCMVVRGYSFDPQVGVYIHPVPECWKPSKGYYEACVRAGVLGELPLR